VNVVVPQMWDWQSAFVLQPAPSFFPPKHVGSNSTLCSATRNWFEGLKRVRAHAAGSLHFAGTVEQDFLPATAGDAARTSAERSAIPKTGLAAMTLRAGLPGNRPLLPPLFESRRVPEEAIVAPSVVQHHRGVNE
jgi:hypothetical protein